MLGEVLHVTFLVTVYSLMKTKIIVDSCVDFNKVFDSIDIPFVRVPFKIILDGNEIIDNGSLSMHELILRMRSTKGKISTACPSPADFMNAIDKDGQNYIITISSELSGSYTSALVAKNNIKLGPNGSVDVIDSRSAAAGENLVTLKVINLIKSGVPRKQIVSEANKYVSSLKTRFVLNSFENFVKNGRISNFSAMVGQFLHIVPIMGDDGFGRISLKEKVRGKNAAILRLKNMIEQEALDSGSKVLAITQVNAKELARKIRNDIARKNIFKEIFIFDAGGLSTVYGDDGGIIVAY